MLQSKYKKEPSKNINRARLLNLLTSEAHVWLAFSDNHSDPKLLAWYRGLLSTEEHERHRSFHFHRDRDLYLLTHGHLRFTLSRYLNTTPDKLAFKKNSHGRPELVPSDGDPPLRFSVSQSHGLAVCLVDHSIDAGVDVEKIRELDNLKTFTEYVFTPLEIEMLRGLPENEQQEAFFTFWSLKESYLKARGTGLSLPLKQFGFHFDAEGRVRISTDARLKDIPSNWQFERFQLGRSHTLAVALRREDRADLRIRFFETIPRCSGGSIPFLNIRQHSPEDLSFLKSGITFRHSTEKVATDHARKEALTVERLQIQ